MEAASLEDSREGVSLLVMAERSRSKNGVASLAYVRWAKTWMPAARVGMRRSGG